MSIGRHHGSLLTDLSPIENFSLYVKDIERANYWAERGFKFNPQYMSAYAMDREAAKSRARQ